MQHTNHEVHHVVFNRQFIMLVSMNNQTINLKINNHAILRYTVEPVLATSQGNEENWLLKAGGCLMQV